MTLSDSYDMRIRSSAGPMAERTFNDADIQTAVSGKDVVVLSTLTASGSPLAMPMWFVNDDESLVMLSVSGQAKVRNLQRDPRVCVVAEGGGRGAMHAIVLTGEVRFYEDEERRKWGDRFRAKYSPDINEHWNGETLPDNRLLFGFSPRVASAFGI